MQKTKKISFRLVLSCSDSVCDVIEGLPDELKQYLPDDLGRGNPSCGGFLSLKGELLPEILGEFDCCAGFREIKEEDIKQHTDCGNWTSSGELPYRLNLIGWDVATGNGWDSAFCWRQGGTGSGMWG